MLFNELMTRLREGDDSAAREIYECFGEQLIAKTQAFLSSRLQSKLDPEDVVQSVFRSFFLRQRDGRIVPQDWNHVWALLVTIAIRKCHGKLDHYDAERRSIHRESGLTDSWMRNRSEIADQDGDPAESAALAEIMEQVFAELSVKEQKILTLYLQGCEVAEIAAELDCGERKAYRVLDHIRGRLRRRLDPDYTPEG